LVGRVRTVGGGVAVHPAVPRGAGGYGADQFRYRLSHRPGRTPGRRGPGARRHRRRPRERKRGGLMPRSRVQRGLAALLRLVVIAWLFTLWSAPVGADPHGPGADSGRKGP